MKMLGRDAEREILMRMDDKDLLNRCRTNREFYFNICDDQFFHRRLQQKYPDTLKNKPEDMSYKAWYLDMVYYAAKLKELFNYEYAGGNPKTQLEIFKSSKDIDSLLESSSAKGELSLVKYFLDQGADIHSLGDEPLKQASFYGHLEVVKYLVERGANINDENVLSTASSNGFLDIVKYLVEQGADINTSGSYLLSIGEDALIRASLNGYLDIVKYLTEQGVDVNASDSSALISASSEGHLDIVKYLVEQGANIHALNDLPLKWAERKGHMEIIKYLKSLP